MTRGLLAAAFVLAGWAGRCGAPAPRPFGDNIRLRGAFRNAPAVFRETGRGTVAFLGGSITEREGYRPLVCGILRRRFPKTRFTFIPAGIASTCSSTGAFRLDRDVLSKGRVDLLFVEFAVNDDQDGRYPREMCIRGMEGIIRHARTANPDMDIAVIFFINDSILAKLRKGLEPLTLEAHGAVAGRYALPTVDVAREVADGIAAGRMTWKEYGGTHPAPFGNALCARMVDELFSRAWAGPAAGGTSPHPMPAALDAFSYWRGRLADPGAAKVKRGWRIEIPRWADLPGRKRRAFTSIPLFCADTPGAEASFSFTGTAVGAFLLSGPDAGRIAFSIDGGAPGTIDLACPFSRALHYPWTPIFSDTLPDGPHELTIRFPDIPENRGKAVRIMRFAVNGRE